MKRRLGQPPEELEKVASNLATLLVFRGEYREAETLYRAVLERRRSTYRPGDLDIATSLRNLGQLLYLRSDFAGAEEALREALALRRRADGARSSTATASVLSALGRVYHAQGRLEEAEPALVEAHTIRSELLGPGHLHVALVEKDLASLYSALGDEAVAEILWDRSLRVLRAKKPPRSWELADAESQLGERLGRRGRRAEAEVCLRQSFETLHRLRGAEALFTRQAERRLEALLGPPDSASSHRTIANDGETRKVEVAP